VTLLDFGVYGSCAGLICLGLTLIVSELGDRVARWVIRRWGA
jgi:hypothetical protein